MTPHPPKTRAELLAYLEGLGVATTTLDHEPVFTVAESEALYRQMPGGHTKNLFLRDAKDRLYLVVAESHTAVDLKALPKLIGSARLSFGKAELLMEVLGVTPGSVTALALINDHEQRVSVVVDERLMQYDSVNCHPLVNTATTALAREDLFRFMRSTGHAPRVLGLAGAAAGTNASG
jgi:Ala-tRNA(Pro) deacylase